MGEEERGRKKNRGRGERMRERTEIKKNVEQ